LIDDIRPRAVICLGLWPGTPLLRVERIAVSIADFEIPDNVGLMTRGPVVEGGDEAYLSALPIHAIRTGCWTRASRPAVRQRRDLPLQR
jgi:pyroglutamyl-peptidase